MYSVCRDIPCISMYIRTTQPSRTHQLHWATSVRCSASDRTAALPVSSKLLDLRRKGYHRDIGRTCKTAKKRGPGGILKLTKGPAVAMWFHPLAVLGQPYLDGPMARLQLGTASPSACIPVRATSTVLSGARFLRSKLHQTWSGTQSLSLCGLLTNIFNIYAIYLYGYISAIWYVYVSVYLYIYISILDTVNFKS